MKKSIAFLVVVDLIFLLVASVPALISGWYSEVVYYALYAGLIALAVLFVRREKTSLRLSALSKRPLHALALFAPAMLLIIGISFLISTLLALLNKSNATDVSGPLVLELLRHALLPALFEEMLFRYVPVRLLGGRSPRAAIVVSSVMFALVHLSLFQIPYALFAGAVLAYITVLTGSVLPSVLLHFANNAVSVICMREPNFAPCVTLIVLAAVSALSAVYIVAHRRDYAKTLKEAFSGERVGFSPEITIAAVVCLCAALLELR